MYFLHALRVRLPAEDEEAERSGACGGFAGDEESVLRQKAERTVFINDGSGDAGWLCQIMRL